MLPPGSCAASGHLCRHGGSSNNRCGCKRKVDIFQICYVMCKGVGIYVIFAYDNVANRSNLPVEIIINIQLYTTL